MAAGLSAIDANAASASTLRATLHQRRQVDLDRAGRRRPRELSAWAATVRVPTEDEIQREAQRVRREVEDASRSTHSPYRMLRR
jgi:hypothetical protein